MKPLIAIMIILLPLFGGKNEQPVGLNHTRMKTYQEPVFRFGVIADAQYCDCESFNTRFYRNSAGKLREAITQFKEDSVDFIVNLGDLIDRNFNSFGVSLSIINEPGLQIIHCLGNHDFDVDRRDLGKVLKLTGTKTAYYSFVHKGFRFIILNGNEIATYSPDAAGRKKAEQLLLRLTEEGSPNAFTWNGGIGEKQLEWLEAELKQSRKANDKVFIFCHFPVYPSGTHNLLNSGDILEILSGYDNIIAWFNGHNHAGGYGNYSLKHFVTLRGMVETEASNSFATVEVFNNKIWIKGSGREKSQILAY